MSSPTPRAAAYGTPFLKIYRALLRADRVPPIKQTAKLNRYDEADNTGDDAGEQETIDRNNDLTCVKPIK